MNFLKSILSEDPEPQNPDPPNPSSSTRDVAGEPAGEFSGETSGGWSFNGLFKTLATQSESVIEIYTRDLKEFGSGLQKEIKELPNEIDTVLKSTKEIIVKKSSSLENSGKTIEKNEGKYSRFERVLRGLEKDENTYVMEVEDKEEYEKWKIGLGFKKNGNESVIGFYEKLVPGKVSEEEFWGRYSFRVYKLRQQEELRERIVKRVISGDDDDDEELTWDVDDDSNGDGDDDDDSNGDGDVDDDSNGGGDEIEGSKVLKSGEMGKKDQVLSDEKSAERDIVGKDGVLSVEKDIVGKDGVLSDEKEIEGKDGVLSDDKSVEKEIEGKGVSNEGKIGEADRKGNEKEKVVSEKIEGDTKGKEKDSSEEKNAKVDNKGLGKDVSIVEEEDMGWDEIEDVDSGDEKKVSGISGSKDKVDLRKRLSVTEDDEDLGWDIEDDEEEPVAKPSAK